MMEYAPLFVFIVVLTVIISIAVVSVMTDPGRIRAREAKDKLEAEVKMAEIKALGVHTSSSPFSER